MSVKGYMVTTVTVTVYGLGAEVPYLCTPNPF